MRKKSIIIFSIVLLLLAGITIVCGIGSSVKGHWFRNADIATWFNSWGEGSSRGDKSDKDGEDEPIPSDIELDCDHILL